MRVLVTGATGFVGRWLVPELTTAGHSVLPAPPSKELDLSDLRRVRVWLESAGQLDGVIHLAGVAFAADADRNPTAAFSTNVGGTNSLFEALRSRRAAPAVLIAGSSDVYGDPEPDDLPLREMSPLRPWRSYALSKLGQESVAISHAVSNGFDVIVTRSFNHTGPGQRPNFVVPAMAERVLALARGRADVIRTGNLDVARDFTDVRDVVRAYRLLLERAVDEPRAHRSVIVNVASGIPRSIRSIVERLCELASVDPIVVLDPGLVRPHDPPVMYGDSSELSSLTGWEPRIDFSETLSDVWSYVSS